MAVPYGKCTWRGGRCASVDGSMLDLSCQKLVLLSRLPASNEGPTCLARLLQRLLADAWGQQV